MFAPVAKFILVEESPRQDTAALLALRHGYGAHRDGAGSFGFAFELGDMHFLRDKRGEPRAAVFEFGAVVDHAADEADLAALAPEFGGLATKVERRPLFPMFPSVVRLVEVPPFPLAAGVGFGGGRVKRRIAHRQVEGFFGVDNAGEDAGWGGLPTQFDMP